VKAQRLDMPVHISLLDIASGMTLDAGVAAELSRGAVPLLESRKTDFDREYLATKLKH
jgi:hypothetical protein